MFNTERENADENKGKDDCCGYGICNDVYVYFAGESSEVIAAAKTKALEINVAFARNAASGDDSGIYVKSLISNKKLLLERLMYFRQKFMCQPFI